MIRLLFLWLTLSLFTSSISAYPINKTIGLVEGLPFHEAPYPNREERPIVGHEDIAPGRKPDPGDFFEWERFLNSLEYK